jgi:hypothetical protein
MLKKEWGAKETQENAASTNFLKLRRSPTLGRSRSNQPIQIWIGPLSFEESTYRNAFNFEGVDYKDAKGDIKNLIDQYAIDQRNFASISYTNSQNKEQPEFLLDFDATMTLITGYRQ